MTVAEPKTAPRWPCALPGGEIECAPRVLNAACLAAMTGLRKLAKGGLEVGGVLFGERVNGLIRILATRPIVCEHRFGPSFVLSDSDKTVLKELLANFRSDAELASLEALGCYFSHSRHGAVLTENDRELFDRYFGRADEIALLLIPNVNGVVQGTLFGRDPGGTLVSCHRFDHSVLNKPPIDQPRVESRRQTPRAEATATSRTRTVAEPAREIVRAKETEPLSEPNTRPAPAAPIRRAAEHRPNAFQMRSALLAASLILFLCWPNHAIPVKQIPLSFTENSNGDLIIHWDTTRPSVRTAVLGVMDIRDGEQTPVHVSIGPDLLQRGWFPYRRRSDLVRISFTLAGRGLTLSDQAIYFAPERRISPPPVSAETEAPDVDPPHREIETLAAAASPPRTQPKPENKTLVARAPEPRKQPRVFRAPLEPLVRTAVPANAKPALLPEAPALRLDFGSGNPLPLHAPSFSLSAPHPAANAPASGRLIWTGQLPKHSMLALSAQGASIGYLNGWIPKGAVHVEVRPGELIEGGMVVFTRDPALHSEAPSLSNGWNTVMYKPDAARASELELLEAPGPANGWSHILLRNGGRSLSVIVVDWRTEQN